MDKYEYKLKLEQLTTLVEEKKYEAAAEIADDVNWRKVRNSNTLMMVGSIYEHMNRYEDCRDVLLQAYEHAKLGRNIVSKLCEVAIDANRLDEAEEYYNEFVEVAPRDNHRYVLAYKIATLRNAPLEDRIAILEELRDQELIEEWGCELAKLYKEANMRDACVRLCDEIVVWFGDGEYVEKALELKRSYQDLTPGQEEKYLEIKGQKAIDEIEFPDNMEDSIKVQTVEEVEQNARFNTTNLQQELAKSMNAIMKSSEDETPQLTEEQIFGAAETRIPQPEPVAAGIAEYEAAQAEEARTAAEVGEEVVEAAPAVYAEEVVEAAPTEYAEEVVEAVPAEIDEPVTEEAEPAMESPDEVVEEASAEELPEENAEDSEEAPQEKVGKRGGITPVSAFAAEALSAALKKDEVQEPVSIEDVLAEWEKTKREAEAAIAAAEKEKADAARAATCAEAAELLARLRTLIPILDPDAGAKEEEKLEAEVEATLAEDVASMNGTKEDKAKEDKAKEDKDAAGKRERIRLEPRSHRNSAPMEMKPVEALQKPVNEKQENEDLEQILAAATLAMKEYVDETTSNENEAEEAAEEAAAPAEEEPTALVAEEMAAFDAEETSAETEPVALVEEEMAASAEEAAETVEETTVAEEPAPVAEPEEEIPQVQDSEEVQSVSSPLENGELSDEQIELFSYFIPVPGMKEQIAQVLLGAEMRPASQTNSASGNILIAGESGSGKTVLATSLIKAMQKISGKTDARIGKISAQALNNRDFATLVPKIAGGYLIVERAGELTKQSAVRMSLVMEQNTKGMTVILEDSKSGIRKAMGLDFGFAKKFTQKINIPIFTIDELVTFAKCYAREMECVIDELAILALYNRINKIQKLEVATTLAEVKDIVDEAIESADNGGIKKMFAKKYDENDYLILREQDFEH